MKVTLPKPLVGHFGVMYSGPVIFDLTVRVDRVLLKSSTSPYRHADQHRFPGDNRGAIHEDHIWSIWVYCQIPTDLAQRDGRPSPLAGKTAPADIQPWMVDPEIWESLLSALTNSGLLIRPVCARAA